MELTMRSVASVTAAISDADLDEAGTMAGILVACLLMVRMGIRTWRGIELRHIARYERAVGPWPVARGSLRKYRTLLGSGHAFVLGCGGSALISATDLIRLALGKDEHWGPWWAASLIGVGLCLVTVAYLVVYRMVGVPDALRPPCQRGWELVNGELVLVRPGRTPKEREERRPITVDPAYRGTATSIWPGRQQPPHEQEPDQWSG